MCLDYGAGSEVSVPSTFPDRSCIFSPALFWPRLLRRVVLARRATASWVISILGCQMLRGGRRRLVLGAGRPRGGQGEATPAQEAEFALATRDGDAVQLSICLFSPFHLSVSK